MTRVTSYTYDSSNSNTDLRHDLLTVTDPNEQSGGPDDGDELTNVYNSSGQITSQTDAMGLTTDFDYSDMDETTLTGTVVVTDPHDNETAYGYGEGALDQTTTGFGTSIAATTGYTVDPATLLDDAVTDPNGHTTVDSFDVNGNQLSSTDPLAQETTTTYNALNEPLVTTDPMGITTTDTYDVEGNLLSTVVTGIGGLRRRPRPTMCVKRAVPRAT